MPSRYMCWRDRVSGWLNLVLTDKVVLRYGCGAQEGGGVVERGAVIHDSECVC